MPEVRLRMQCWGYILAEKTSIAPDSFVQYFFWLDLTFKSYDEIATAAVKQQGLLQSTLTTALDIV